MFVFEKEIRVHYALTDQMGVVYHGNYAQFYEIGRTEALRSLGITYHSLEQLGFFMPVIEMNMKFLRPARYDDLINVKITLKEIPANHKIAFHGEIFNQKNELLNVSTVILYFMDAKTMTRVNMPESIREKLIPFFE